MIDNPNSAHTQSQAAFISSKALALIERMQKLNFHKEQDIMGVLASRTQTPYATRINLRITGQLLSLNSIEKAWLETAYVWSRSGLALPDVQITDEEMRWRVLGAISDDKVKTSNAAWINAAQRLRGLGLLMPRRYRVDNIHMLSDDLVCHPAVIEVLERRHSSHAHLLNELIKPRLEVVEEDWLFSGVREPAFLASVPPVIEDAYQRYRKGEPLCVTNLMGLIPWWCDWTAFDVSDLQWLASRMHLPEIRAAIQTATRIACQQQRATTGFDLLKTLYAVAK